MKTQYTDEGPAFPYTTNPDEIPTRKVLDITPENGNVHVEYACPMPCWTQHLASWRHEMTKGNKCAPQPMPFNHCMFEDPAWYGCVHYGDSSEASKRAAIESHVRGTLHGWDRDMPPERLEAIVKATVDAKMQGIDTGAAPFVACVAAWL